MPKTKSRLEELQEKRDAGQELTAEEQTELETLEAGEEDAA